MADPILDIAETVVKVEFGDLPSAVVEATKKDILDTLATTLAGSAVPGGKEVAEVMADWGGKEESSVLVFGGRLPAPSAALANGTMAHALDFDDTYDAIPLHAGAATISASLAVAEAVGPVSGERFIAAVTMGVDVMCRLGLATVMGLRGWHLTGVYGYFGAAAAAGKLLGLDRGAMVDALGLAYAQAAGNNQGLHDGALTKRLNPGFGARGGITAAYMARRGITGGTNILAGKTGLFEVYHRGEYDPEPLRAELGTRFEVANLSYKPWPCGRALHGFIDATLQLVHEFDIRPDEVLGITIYVESDDWHFAFPLETKRRPRNHVDTQFSVPWVVATAIARRKVVIDDFTEQAIGDPIVLGLAEKVTPQVSDDMKRPMRDAKSGAVSIRTKRGEWYRRVDLPRGHPSNPLAIDDICEKFRDCAAHAARPLERANVEAALDLVRRLEEQDDIRSVIALLVPHS